MRRAVRPESLNQYTPDLIEPLRDAAASAFGRARDQGFEVVGTEGTQAAIALALMASVDPGDEVILSDPGYFHIPSAVLAAGAVPVAVPISSRTGFRLDPDDVARAITPRTRAICLVDPLNPYGTVQTRDELVALAELADRHGALLIHDVTHAPLALDPDAPFASLPALALTDNAVAAMSVSHCYGMAGARIGFLGGPPGFVRGCLQLKAALTRLNTNLISQHGALAALADESYLARAERTIVANLRHLEETLDDVPGVRLAVRPQRGLACALEVSGTSAQELMVALFARRVAVYPGDGLGETAAASTIRINLSRPDAWAMEHLRGVLARRGGGGLVGPLARARGVAARGQGHRPGRAARPADRRARVSRSPMWVADVGRFSSNLRRVRRRLAGGVAAHAPRVLVQDQPPRRLPARGRACGRGRRGRVRGRVRARDRRRRDRPAQDRGRRSGQARCAAGARRRRRGAGARRFG